MNKFTEKLKIFQICSIGGQMDINLLFKIAAIGILVAVLYQVLVRAGREDQAMMTTLAGLVIVLSMVIQEISSLFDTVKTAFGL
jgi:stage III sporulation protein AC